MMRRQTLPRQWLVADDRLGEALWRVIRGLPRGSGILFLYPDMPKRERAQLLAKVRRAAQPGGHLVADEAAGEAARVHDLPELRRAALRGVPIVFLSPVFPTRSHPGWMALPKMKAAGLVRLATVPVIALGGMDARRFRRVEPLGFSGWAGIDAYGR